MSQLRLPALLAAAFAALVSLSSQAAQKDHFSVCWTIYAGWMPWEYAGSQGIVDKWAKKYGIKIDVCSSTTMSNRSTSTPPASSTAAP
jgi:NitT/TauT family transport system substrate-binding protein